MATITVALLAQGIGFATGFGDWTFRVIQLSAQLVAPLLLAWGLVELVARGAAVRFGARLATAAVTVVAGVVLATDPLADTEFGKTWPAASAHYQVIPHYALTLVALVAGVTVLAVLAVCAARGRKVPADGRLVIGVAAVVVATLLLIALRFSLPSPAYPALCGIAAAVLWLGMSRLGGLISGPAAVASEAEGADGVRRSRGFKGDKKSRGGNNRGSHGGDDRRSREADDRESRGRDDRGFRGGDDRGDRRADDRQRDPLRDPLARPPAADDFGAPDFPPVGRASARRDDRDLPDWPGRDRPNNDRPNNDRPNNDRHSRGRSGGRPRYQPDLPGSEPATGMFDVSLPGLGDIPLPASATTSQAQPGTDLALPVTPPHGLIAIYTLLDDKVADFDRAADEVAEQVRSDEPDTLVYVIHTVPKAPMQRIFYEVYRDRAAYEQHEKQPYVQRFVTARRPYVLATNVIELRLKYAKVSPLPQAEAQAAQAQAAQSQPQAQTPRPASAPNLPAVRNGNGGRPDGSRPDGSRPNGNGSRPSGGRQDTDYPGRDPGSRPGDPGYQPRHPAYQPRDPGHQPRDPGFQPRDPAYQQRDPGYAPRDPGYEPRDPGYQPRDPAYQQRDSGYAPRDPGHQPRDPGYQPRDPGFQPRDPGYQPRDPGFQPRDPAYQQRDPGYAPRDPGYQPRDPGFYPRAPLDPGYPPREPRHTPNDQDYPPYPARDREYPARDREYPARDREYPARDREYPSRDREYLSPDRGYPPPEPEYPSNGHPSEWSRQPRDPYAEPGDSYAEPRDPYDPPTAPRYDRI
jgi:quinol monooxygenase YgiN